MLFERLGPLAGTGPWPGELLTGLPAPPPFGVEKEVEEFVADAMMAKKKAVLEEINWFYLPESDYLASKQQTSWRKGTEAQHHPAWLGTEVRVMLRQSDQWREEDR